LTILPALPDAGALALLTSVDVATAKLAIPGCRRDVITLGRVMTFAGVILANLSDVSRRPGRILPFPRHCSASAEHREHGQQPQT